MSHDPAIIEEIIHSIEQIATETGGPSLIEQVQQRIESYVDLVHILEDIRNPDDVERLMSDVKFATEHKNAIHMNDHVQTVVFFGDRGLVDVDIPEDVERRITHPSVRMFGTIDPHQFALEIPPSEDESSDEFYDTVVNGVITSLAVRQILGPIRFWINPNAVCPTKYLSVHQLSSTIH